MHKKLSYWVDFSEVKDTDSTLLPYEYEHGSVTCSALSSFDEMPTYRYRDPLEYWIPRHWMAL